MRIAFDSNLLIYLAQVWKVEADREKSARLEQLLPAFTEDVTIILPYQALGEAYRVMSRYGYSRDRCHDTLLDWAAMFETVGSSADAFVAALDLAHDHQLQFWDALIIAVAAQAGCTLLLSEDLQSGFSWRGITLVNPFTATLDDRLTRILEA